MLTNTDTSEQQPEIPIWKASLMKKRAEQEKLEEVIITLLE